MIRLRITSDGHIRGLWTDEVSFAELGTIRVRRASHVEFDDRQQCWCVRSAAPLSVLLRLFRWLSGTTPRTALYRAPTRTSALVWEHDYFEPGGPGWPNST